MLLSSKNFYDFEDKSYRDLNSLHDSLDLPRESQWGKKNKNKGKRNRQDPVMPAAEKVATEFSIRKPQ